MGKSLEELQRGLQLAPDDAGAHQALGMALKQKGDIQGASDEFRKAEALNKARNTQAATLVSSPARLLPRTRAFSPEPYGEKV